MLAPVTSIDARDRQPVFGTGHARSTTYAVRVPCPVWPIARALRQDLEPPVPFLSDVAKHFAYAQRKVHAVVDREKRCVQRLKGARLRKVDRRARSARDALRPASRHSRR